jgi:hypothetical protein
LLTAFSSDSQFAWLDAFTTAKSPALLAAEARRYRTEFAAPAMSAGIAA